MAPSVIASNPPSPAANGVFASCAKKVNGMPHVCTEKQNSEDIKAACEAQYQQHSVPFNPQYALNPRKLRIITIGAGFSGLLVAHKFQHRFPELQDFVEHTIFEGRSDLGGTWLVNTYPGVQCDVPSHIYVSLASKEMNYL